MPVPAHARAASTSSRPSPHDPQLRLEPSLAGAAEALDQDVRRLARLERPDEQEVRCPSAAGPSPSRRGASGTARTRDRLQPPLADQLAAHDLGVAQHARGAAREPARAGRAVPDALVAREVLRALLPGAVVDRQHERGRADRQRRRGRGPDDVAAAQQRVEPGPAGQPPRRRTAPARAARGGRGPSRAGRVATPRGQQHAVLVVRERRREGLEQGGRIVRHPACPAADQAAPVDPDPHASCPVTASPSTPAPPHAPSSAASSAGRASSPRGCPRSGPAPTRSSRRAPRLVHRAGHAWEQLVLPLRAARAAGAAVPRQPRAAGVPAQRRRDPRRRRAAPSRVVLAGLRGLAAARPPGPGPSRAARRDRIRVLARRARRTSSASPRSASA